jgi:hypothetical protein
MSVAAAPTGTRCCLRACASSLVNSAPRNKLDLLMSYRSRYSCALDLGAAEAERQLKSLETKQGR